MKKIVLFSAAVLMLNALPAFAEDGGKQKRDGGKMLEKIFADQDADSNGTISKDEFLAHSTKRFEAMDGNKDGGVTKEEIKSHFEAKRAERKAKKDAAKTEAAPAPAEKTAE